MIPPAPPHIQNEEHQSNSATVFRQVLEKSVSVSKIPELLLPKSHNSSLETSIKRRKPEGSQCFSLKYLQTFNFNSVANLLNTSIKFSISESSENAINLEHSFQTIIDEIKTQNSEIKATLSRQSYLLLSQMKNTTNQGLASQQLNAGANAKYVFENESPEIQVIKHKIQKVEERKYIMNGQIQNLENENKELSVQINKTNNKNVINNYRNKTVSKIPSLNENKTNKIKNAEIQQSIQSQQRKAVIQISKEKQEVERLLNECEVLQSQIAQLDSRIELMSKSNKNDQNFRLPTLINKPTVVAVNQYQTYTKPNQRKIQKRQRIVFRKPVRVVLPSLPESINNTKPTVKVDPNILQTDTNQAIQNNLLMNNFKRKRRMTGGPSPYDIEDQSLFKNDIIYTEENIDSIDTSTIIGEDTCFYDCPPNTEPSRSFRIDPSVTDTNDHSQSFCISNNETDKIDQSNPLKIDQSNPLKIDQSNPLKIDQSNPLKTDQSNPLKIDQSNPSKIDQSNTLKTDQSNPLKIDQSNPLKIDQSNPLKIDQSNNTVEPLNNNHDKESNELENNESTNQSENKNDHYELILNEIENDNDQNQLDLDNETASVKSNVSRKSSSKPASQKSNPVVSLNEGNKPYSQPHEENEDANRRPQIKICTKSPLTDDLLRLPMPQSFQLSNNYINYYNQIQNNEDVPVLLCQMPIMVRNSAEFFSRINSEKRNSYDYYASENSESSQDSIKARDSLNTLQGSEASINDSSQANNGNGYPIKEPTNLVDQLAPRSKHNLDQR